MLVLRFIKNLTEGHNEETQEFLREQQGLRYNIEVLNSICGLAKALACRFKRYMLYINPFSKDYKRIYK